MNRPTVTELLTFCTCETNSDHEAYYGIDKDYYEDSRCSLAIGDPLVIGDPALSTDGDRIRSSPRPAPSGSTEGGEPSNIVVGDPSGVML